MSEAAWVPAGRSRSGPPTWPKGLRDRGWVLEGPAPTTCSPASHGLKGVGWEQVVVGGLGEVELLAKGMVVAWAAQPQRLLKIPQLPHEAEVGGGVGLLPLDQVVGVIKLQFHLLHQVDHGDPHRVADRDRHITILFASYFNNLGCNILESKV